MAWIELHQELREHRKLFACAELLNVSRVTMLGTVASLWLWALDNAQSGSLAGISAKTIARVCDWPEKKAQKLIDALHQTGWLDHDGESYHIHDWLDYAGRLIERREKEAKRKQESRNQKRTVAGCPQDVPRTSAENPALPPPQPYLYRTNNKSGCGGEPRAQESADDSLLQIGIQPGDFLFSIPAEVVADIKSVTMDLFGQFADRSYVPNDCRKVFEHITRFDPQVADGVHIDHNAEALLRYAFNQASLAGKPGNWRYIAGVMERLAARDITTVEEALDYDENRAGGGA